MATLSRLNSVRRLTLAIAVVCTARAQTAVQPTTQVRSNPDAAAIIHKSLERDFYNFNSVKDYTYVEREEDREYDGAGKLKKTESSTQEVLILAGRPYEKEIAK